MPSLTGATEALAKAQTQRDACNYREALVFYEEALVIRTRHIYEPPFSTPLESADIRIEISKMLSKIVECDLVDNVLMASYRGLAASHLLKAMKIRKEVLGTDHLLIQQTSDMILKC
mmetsp:Transcript_13827/g.16288  ORF Transcript_13827/g.16288 Transcript_13827/m.16288 type:complete len:117 (-) Transcript_13827:380-730(-)|eukprot:CAMPEP_0198255934 /NCGR_PEP_ID=MMETSP1447-20131203/5950_1 /TAXON_ID=420782 /ORGANISM="Chaetoceros dichaeta, Strain CCMP1751" /LENGTH=116 /DNA_ID=CAMNT_0043942435 /DNA_START=90 /DNA_END=440 /DNA_ORIENTATION=+